MQNKRRSPMQQELLQRRRSNSLAPNPHLLPTCTPTAAPPQHPLVSPLPPQPSQHPAAAAAANSTVTHHSSSSSSSTPSASGHDVQLQQGHPQHQQQYQQQQYQQQQYQEHFQPSPVTHVPQLPPPSAHAPKQKQKPMSEMQRYLLEQRRMARRPSHNNSKIIPPRPAETVEARSPSSLSLSSVSSSSSLPPPTPAPPPPPSQSPTHTHPQQQPQLKRRPSYSPAARSFTPPMTTSYGTPLRRYKALLIGIGYVRHRFLKPLAGCRTDVINMYNLLTGPLFHFSADNIHVLCDEHIEHVAAKVDLPTRMNIIRELSWLTRGIKPGDSVVFFFAGHGDFVVDLSGDEIETGFDQCIMPMDYEKPALHGAGKLPRGAPAILDDVIYERLVRCVPDGAKVTALVDACRSGTVCDLPVQYDADGQVLFRNGSTNPPRLRNQHHLAAGGFVLFSGCADSQFSADMVIADPESPDKTVSCGIMTKAFVDAVAEMVSQRQHDANGTDQSKTGVEMWTYGMLMMRIRQLVTFWATQVVGDHAPIQEPQMSSSHALNIWHTLFSM